jgi:hypothetical protein
MASIACVNGGLEVMIRSFVRCSNIIGTYFFSVDVKAEMAVNTRDAGLCMF